MDAFSSADIILRGGVTNHLAEEVLTRYGYWVNSWFISDFFLGFFFRNCKSKQIIDATIDNIITYGLSRISRSHIVQSVSPTSPPLVRYEDAIGHYFGLIIADIAGLYVSPQHIIPKGKPSRGKLPCVDYFINGNLNTFVELIRDSNLVESHFDRFVKSDGAYYSQKKPFIVLDIVTRGDSRFQLQGDYAQYKSLFYTFIVDRNVLYKGDDVLKLGVSELLTNPA
jgi:hypothetical protein